MKRKLGNEYRYLVNYVKDKQRKVHLGTIVNNFTDLTSEAGQLVNELDAIKCSYNEKLDYLIPIIVDIYNNNYELEEPKYYWKFKELRGLDECDFYFGTIFYYKPLLVDISDGGDAKKCTKSELNDYLLDTNLTTDNFTPIVDVH